MEEATQIPNTLLRGMAGISAVPLPEKPRLVPWLSTVELGDGRIQLRAVDFAMTFSEPLLAGAFRMVARLLDGNHSLAQVVNSGGSEYLSTTIELVLKALRQRGALQEGKLPPGLTAEVRDRYQSELSFLAHHVRDPERVLSVLQSAKVVVIGSAAVSQHVVASLMALGLARTEAAAKASDVTGVDLLIAAADTPATAFFETINRACLESETRWLRVAYEGGIGVLGPAIVPRQTACYACYIQRRATHGQADGRTQYEQQMAAVGEASEGSLAALAQILAAQTALEVARMISGFAPAVTFGRSYTFEAGTPRVTGHDVLRVPRCRACGQRGSPRDPWRVNDR